MPVTYTTRFAVSLGLLIGCASILACSGGISRDAAESATPEFGGKIARSYEDSVEWWADPIVPPQDAPKTVRSDKGILFDGFTDPISPIFGKLKDLMFFIVFPPATTRQLSQTLSVGAGAGLRARQEAPTAARRRT